MGFNLKGTTTNSGGFPLIPTGRYNVRVESADLATSNAGNPAINIKYIIDDGPEKDKIVFDTVAITDSSLWKVKELLEAVKSKLVDSADAEAPEMATALQYQKLNVMIYTTKNQNGVDRNSVKQPKPYVDPKSAGSAGSTLVF